MGKSIQGIIEKLALLEKQKQEMEVTIEMIVNEAISRAAKTKAMNRIGKHCFLVKFSEIAGHPWAPYYHDWEQSADVVKRFLENKPRTEWKSALQKKLDETKPGKEVVFVFSSGSRFWRTREGVPVSPDFIREIINQLD